MATEEPKFTVVSRTEHFEVRLYQKVLVAETEVEAEFGEAGNKAFRILADYIFGNNRQNQKLNMTSPVSQTPKPEKIAMTAPVTQLKNPKGFTVQFTMPEGYTLDTIPTPNDPRVKLRELPSRKVAAYEYSGTWSESRYNEKLAHFQKELEIAGLKSTTAPTFARFNSPFTPWFLRRNEIWVEVAE